MGTHRRAFRICGSHEEVRKEQWLVHSRVPTQTCVHTLSQNILPHKKQNKTTKPQMGHGFCRLDKKEHFHFATNTLFEDCKNIIYIIKHASSAFL